MSKKKALTKEELAYRERVRELGCIICLRPAQIHHLRYVAGAGQRASEREIIPLCADHHTDGGYGVAFHAGKQAFEAEFGTEEYLHRKTKELLGGD